MVGRIPSRFIDELLANSDIVGVIERFVPLQKKGREYMACCPFHEEKTPSFSVSPRKQFFYCFGCGVGGSAIQFLMQHQKIEFVEAVESLAQMAGLEVPREGGGAAVEAQVKPVFAALVAVSELYQKNLADSPAVNHYLKQRGIDPETIKTFALGYAAAGFDNLKRAFSGKQREQILLKAGLLARKEGTDHSYDKFRDRLMFPIRDGRGRTIAFGGRVMKDDDQPKYLNSPETQVFHKRRTLYGIYEIRGNRKLDQVLVVEGYMDVVSLHAHGIKNAVATLGTAVTQQHIQQLFRLCSQLVFCFDGDQAGRKAANSALQQALPVFRDGYNISFMTLPQGEDPDSFVKTQGQEALNTAIRNAVPLSAFMFDTLREQLDLSLPEGRAAFVERARPLLGQLPQGAFRNEVTSDFADKAGIESGYLLNPATQPAKPIQSRDGDRKKIRHSLVRVAISMLLGNPGLARDALSSEEIRGIDRPGTALLADMLEHVRRKPQITAAALLEQYRNSEYETALVKLLHWEAPPDAQAEFQDVMQRLHQISEQQTLNKLIRKSQTATLSEQEQKELHAHLSRKTNPGG